MLLKTITNSKLSIELMENIIIDPKGFKMMMNIAFLINIIMFIISIISVEYLFIGRPENPLMYFIPSALFVFYFRIIFSYREYFGVFIESFILQYRIIKQMESKTETDEETHTETEL